MVKLNPIKVIGTDNHDKCELIENGFYKLELATLIYD